MIAAGFLKEVRDILIQFATFAEKGTLPNMIHGGDASNRDTSDAPLWFFVACSDFCQADGNAFLDTPVKHGKTLLDILEEIAEGYRTGTPNGIRVDSASGLVFSPSHFTWMDTNYPAGTPREGYPIEIQALWFFALQFLARSGRHKWETLAQQVRETVKKRFIRKDGMLSDCLHGRPGSSVAESVADDHLRPNQLFAVTLGLIDDKDVAARIVDACAELLIPGAIRSLADREVQSALPIRSATGPLINDPLRPYWGEYKGNEDALRKPAYHNGTAWTWPFPSWCEAYWLVYGESGKRTARSILASANLLLDTGCVAHLPEILDGNAPHRQRGCDAQAWGVTELFRVWKLLNS
jgi:predicted glycogen debranching enzyme